VRLFSGSSATDVDFVIAQHLVFPAHMGASFINGHFKAPYARRRRARCFTDAAVPFLSCTTRGTRQRGSTPRDATGRLSQRLVLRPHLRTANLITDNLAGQILVAPHNRLNKHHRCQTACGLAVFVPVQRFSVEITNLGDRAVCLLKATLVAAVTPDNYVHCLFVTYGTAAQSVATSDVLKQVDVSGVPDCLLPDMQAPIFRLAYMRYRTL